MVGKKDPNPLPPVPSIYDTHCEGAGLEHGTAVWPRYKSFYYRWLNENGARDVPLPPKVNLQGKTALVSGANSGIGKEAAYVLASWGAHVILACRDPPPHEDHPEAVIEEFVQRSKGEISKSQLEWWKVDYADLTSVRKLGERFIESGRTLDYLFNNAGLNMKKFVRTKDGFELVNQVNYLSHVLLTYIVLPAMKNAKAPRIINTSSSFHYGGTLDFSNFALEKEFAAKKSDGEIIAGYGEWYCDSKLKLAMWNKELQQRMARSKDYRHVIAHAIHPGYVASNVWNSGWMSNTPAPLRAALGYGLRNIAIDNAQGSLAMLHAALLPERGIEALASGGGAAPAKEDVPDRFTETVGGKFYFRIHETPTRPEVHDATARARLWERTNEDLKAKKLGLDKVLPGPLPGLK